MSKNNVVVRKTEFETKYECGCCGEKEKVFRTFDIDGLNLVESLVCLNCRDGEASTKSNF
jgi:transcription elongation factor Elf1